MFIFSSLLSMLLSTTPISACTEDGRACVECSDGRCSASIGDVIVQPGDAELCIGGYCASCWGTSKGAGCRISGGGTTCEAGCAEAPVGCYKYCY